jgi:hypothetical protein
MQLDADDEDEPFFRPQVMQTEPLLAKPGERSEQAPMPDLSQSQSTVDQDHSGESQQQDPHHMAAAVSAAMATAEQED